MSVQPPREEMLTRLLAGDVVHASSPGSSANMTCIITSIDETAIHARRLIVPRDYIFDRRTGAEVEGGDAVIDSIEPLPIDVYNQIMWLDRKSRLSWDLTKAKLSPADKNALLFLSDHYEKNQLLPLGASVVSPQVNG
ncbi:hypothetical protein ACFQI3_11190 [Hansschlegelia quercus]|uniref:Uncharacterized protein n=1 Tax=Hansschlegelia quercus TaxID=2528245 RepID=A0A4Q9G9Q8_9HYPH|nr:hypothetical protein [Hansschlegelia quercus]TBN47617.1 hypothetical protein EYR15_15785 [Hansschlegelia quercus]